MYKIVFKIQKFTHVGVFLKREYEINVFMYVCNIPVHLFWRFSTARSCTACSCVWALHVSALLAAVFALCKCTFLQGCHSFWRSAALPCTVRRNHAPSTVLYSMFNTLEVGKGIFFQGL